MEPLFSDEGAPFADDVVAGALLDDEAPRGEAFLAAFAARVNRALARSLDEHVDLGSAAALDARLDARLGREFTDHSVSVNCSHGRSASLREFDGRGARPAPRLLEAMRYALLAGGKRLRPALVVEAARAAGGLPLAAALKLAGPAALAVELVHTYSLIHDDLPALDNDALRRGRPTLHLAFDEATAILAGDALLTDAFGLLARARHRAAEQVLELSFAAGSAGMISGQVDDLDNEGAPAEAVDLPAIHRRKTGRLFEASCVLGGLSVDAGPDTLDALRRYGRALGLAFQIADDILDETSTAARAGKHVGRDAQRQKVTYPSRYGLGAARAMAQAAAERAVNEARRLGPASRSLEELARFAAHRDR